MWTLTLVVSLIPGCNWTSGLVSCAQLITVCVTQLTKMSYVTGDWKDHIYDCNTWTIMSHRCRTPKGKANYIHTLNLRMYVCMYIELETVAKEYHM